MSGSPQRVSIPGCVRRDLTDWRYVLVSDKLPTDKEAIRGNVLASIARLQTKPDLLLIHNPFVVQDGNISQFWTYLEDLVLDGTLEGVSLGVSNFRPQDLEAILRVARIKPVANRKSFNILYEDSSRS